MFGRSWRLLRWSVVSGGAGDAAAADVAAAWARIAGLLSERRRLGERRRAATAAATGPPLAAAVLLLALAATLGCAAARIVGRAADGAAMRVVSGIDRERERQSARPRRARSESPLLSADAERHA
jgi:hypothetical protein